LRGHQLEEYGRAPRRRPRIAAHDRSADQPRPRRLLRCQGGCKRRKIQPPHRHDATLRPASCLCVEITITFNFAVAGSSFSPSFVSTALKMLTGLLSGDGRRASGRFGAFRIM
jgi:hypothetical protein